jgi:iron-sulfur cluster insertion protein
VHEPVTDLLVFTDAAARKVGQLIAGEGNPKLMLRVFVQGGGCSGLQYGFEFDEQVQDGDTCVENQGVKLLIDPMSFQYLGGAEIDFRSSSATRTPRPPADAALPSAPDLPPAPA